MNTGTKNEPLAGGADAIVPDTAAPAGTEPVETSGADAYTPDTCAETPTDTTAEAEPAGQTDTPAGEEEYRGWNPFRRWNVSVGDKALWVIVITLLIISMLTIYSSMAGFGYNSVAQSFSNHYFRTHLLTLGGTFVVMIIAYFVPCTFCRRITPAIFAITLILTLLTTYTPLGVTINGARRWMSFFKLFNFQPSELLKLSTVMMLAHQIARNQKVIGSLHLLPLRRWWRAFRSVLNKEYFKRLLHSPIATVKQTWQKMNTDPAWQIMYPMIFAVIAILPSHFSSAFLVGIISFMMLYFGRVRWRQLGLLFAIVLALGVGLMVFKLGGRGSTAHKRSGTFIDIWRYELMHDASGNFKRHNDLNDTEMSMIAVHDGGLLGLGAGRSEMRGKIMHPESDYIFALLVEEYGGLMAVFVLLLFVWIFGRALRMFDRSGWIYAGLLEMGMATLIVVQALLHICVSINFFPETGQNLPLISHGTTSMLCSAVAFGLILGISRQIENDMLFEPEMVAGCDSAGPTTK